MQFNHTWQKVLSGDKTQTRRLALPESDGTGEFPCEMIIYPDGIMAVMRRLPDWSKWHTRYQKGKSYAVQPGWRKKSVGYIRLKDFWRDGDVRNISPRDVMAEGFDRKSDFLLAWCKMHDKEAVDAYPDSSFAGQALVIQQNNWMAWLKMRPAECYQAWALEFELIQGLMRNA